MKQTEIPSKPIFNGEAVCPFPIDGTIENLFNRRQWFFEAAYVGIGYGVPFAKRFLSGSGFDQYQFFKGQQRNPFPPGVDAWSWWEFEFQHSVSSNKAIPFVLYFRDWIADKAAPANGHNLELSGNPWLESYMSEVV